LQVEITRNNKSASCSERLIWSFFAFLANMLIMKPLCTVDRCLYRSGSFQRRPRCH
jgi:hypothetical protein